MKKNKVHCLIINQSTLLTKELSRAISHHQHQGFVEVFDGALHQLKAKIINNQIGLLFITKGSIKPAFQVVAKMLRQYSPDTVLVFLTAKNEPVQQDLVGIEQCDLSLNHAGVSRLIVSYLLHYAQVKQDLRHSKHLLSIMDQRNRWLVGTTHEPIAYIYQGLHVHANPAYLALFGFHSLAELMGTPMDELIPVANQAVFTRFVKQQKNFLVTRHSLLLTMQTHDKQLLRSDIRIVPAVLNNTKCLQILVHPLKVEHSRSRVRDVSKIKTASTVNIKTKAKTSAQKKATLKLAKQQVQQTQMQTRKTDSTDNIVTKKALPIVMDKVNINKAKEGEVGLLKDKLSLKQLIAFVQKNQLNKLDMQPLQDTSSGTLMHYFVEMPLSHERIASVKKQLKSSYGMSADMFKDYVTIASLISLLRKQGKAGERYIVALDIANLQDKRFSRWLSVQLQQLPTNTAQVVFLLPYYYCKHHANQLAGFLYSLKNTGGYIGWSDFTPSVIGMNMIKRFQVRYIAFSAQWLERVRANKRQQQVLSSLTQKLGRSGIEVIVSPSKAA